MRSVLERPQAVLLFLLLIAGVAPRTAIAQARTQAYTIAGTVRDTAGVPLAYAYVWAERERKSAVTNEQGRFQLALSRRGPATILVRRIGFSPVTIEVDVGADSAGMSDVALIPIVVALAPVEVRGAASDPLARTGFYQRLLDRQRGAGNGTFITPEEIQLHNPTYITSMFNKAPGIFLRPHPRVGMIPFGANSCRITIYIDGQRLDSDIRGGASVGPRIGGVGTVGRASGAGPGIDETLNANAVAGVEIYPRGVQVPPQFQMLNGTCGVVAIWTKS